MPTPQQLRFSDYLQTQGVGPEDVEGVCTQALGYAAALGRREGQGKMTRAEVLDELQGAQEIVLGVLGMFTVPRPGDLN